LRSSTMSNIQGTDRLRPGGLGHLSSSFLFFLLPSRLFFLPSQLAQNDDFAAGKRKGEADNAGRKERRRHARADLSLFFSPRGLFFFFPPPLSPPMASLEEGRDLYVLSQEDEP